MLKNNLYRWILLSSLVALVTLGSCQKDSDEEVTPTAADSAAAFNTQVKSAVYDLMKQWYLWNDQLPEIDVADYDSPQDVLEALRYQDLDRFSYIEDLQTFENLLIEGKFVGNGFGLKVDADQNLRVSFVYRNSPMDKQGVTRGYKIVQVNGQDAKTLVANETLFDVLGEDAVGVQTQFLVEDPTSKQRTVTVAKEEITMNTVLHRSVENAGGKKVGYLVYNSFLDKSKTELDEAFQYLKSENVSELVLDLRYNGGGSLDIARYLAGLIGAMRAPDKEFVEITYNKQKQSENQSFTLKTTANDVTVPRLFVITTRSTASASEAIINGLRPYMEVITIGDDTYGKPVGMNAFPIKAANLAVVPITFKVANASGEAEYYDGIPASALVTDDLAATFGDETEACLQEALYYIQNGQFSGSTARKGIEPIPNQLELEGFRREIGAF